MDTDLSFSPHIDQIVSQARGISAVILRAFSTRSVSILVSAFTTFARPILEYASPVFNSIAARESDALESVQKWFTHRVYKRCGLPNTPYRDRLLALGLDLLHTRRIIADLSLCHASFSERHYCPSLSHVPPRHSYPTTRRHYLTAEPRATGFRARFFSNRVASLWNSLPPRLVTLSNDAFKDALLLLVCHS